MQRAVNAACVAGYAQTTFDSRRPIPDCPEFYRLADDRDWIESASRHEMEIEIPNDELKGDRANPTSTASSRGEYVVCLAQAGKV
jgi:hypothetical protein